MENTIAIHHTGPAHRHPERMRAVLSKCDEALDAEGPDAVPDALDRAVRDAIPYGGPSRRHEIRSLRADVWGALRRGGIGFDPDIAAWFEAATDIEARLVIAAAAGTIR